MKFPDKSMLVEVWNAVNLPISGFQLERIPLNNLKDSMDYISQPTIISANNVHALSPKTIVSCTKIILGLFK